MKVYGVQVPDGAILGAFREIVEKLESFETRSVQHALERNGCPDRKDVSYRASDRLVQKWKREGYIFFDTKHRTWSVVKGMRS